MKVEGEDYTQHSECVEGPEWRGGWVLISGQQGQEIFNRGRRLPNASVVKSMMESPAGCQSIRRRGSGFKLFKNSEYIVLWCMLYSKRDSKKIMRYV